MTKLFVSKVAVMAGGLALALSAGAGIAAAEPDLAPAVNTTCTYDQWSAALRDQNPQAAAGLDSQPMAQSYLRQFFAGGPAERQRFAQMFLGMPNASESVPIMQQAFSACNNY